MPTSFIASMTRLPEIGARDAAHGAEALAELLPDRQHRIERAERVLEHHRHVAGAQPLDLRGGAPVTSVPATVMCRR